MWRCSKELPLLAQCLSTAVCSRDVLVAGRVAFRVREICHFLVQLGVPTVMLFSAVRQAVHPKLVCVSYAKLSLGLRTL